ncbi:hypothetical protein FSC12_15955 (plasmid) [Acinetobacter schindleri]|uniref:hypothetical protein n=1 Tax=Acinetobacter schindleri TaxID=108981 RepID=UPI0013B09712|nr:hypothetical protein [Acinetobacter schindleri]QIC62790.1 hypothetical protein FSC12_15955 [Acinetobacter schindleri]
MGGIIIEEATLSGVLKILKEDGIDLTDLEKKYKAKVMCNEIPGIPSSYAEESLNFLKEAIENT